MENGDKVDGPADTGAAVVQLSKTSALMNGGFDIIDSNVFDMCDDAFLQLFKDAEQNHTVDKSKLRTDQNYFGFDNNAGDSYIYPTNYPVRQYQYNITKKALFQNTLVVLPTGLGKTFLAAVVMYNFYRWYPRGKVIFMAPTKPLVGQQIEACYQIMGIPKADTIELTGQNVKAKRTPQWLSKRVFFVTPQVLAYDLEDADFPIDAVKLIVVDEAHKAKGRYAYSDVIAKVTEKNKMFRVLALSATPGNKIEDVVEVVRNLLISHIEVRTDNCIDVAPYTHKKSIKTVVVKLDDQIREIRNELIDIIDPYVRNLIGYDVITGTLNSLSRNWLLMQQKRYNLDSLVQRHPQHSSVKSDFASCIGLYHALELLDRHGIRIFLNFFDNDESEAKFFVAKDPRMRQFVDKIREMAGPNPFSADDSTMTNGHIADFPMNLDFGHPKFEILRKHLLEHFEAHKDTRAIVFCEYRESVHLVHRLLLQNRPLVKPNIFVGKGKSVTQKQQIATMTKFRNGDFNVLIATCVAEEGIDVGEVDLIICFDINTKNPTRFVQRIGRTGRKRQGKVIMLVTEGKEHGTLKEVMATKDRTNKKILNNNDISRALYQSPRLVPTEFNPQCIETFIKIKKDEPPPPAILGRKNRGKRKVKANNEMDQNLEFENPPPSVPNASRKPNPKLSQPNNKNDLRQFFKPVIELDADEQDIFCTPQLRRRNYSETVNGNEEEKAVAFESVVADIDVINLDDLDKKDEVEKLVATCEAPNQDLFLEKFKQLHGRVDRTKSKIKVRDKIKVPRFHDILHSSKATFSLKKIAVKNNVHLWRDLYLAKSTEENDLAVVNEDCEMIKTIFGGHKNVMKILSNFQPPVEERNIFENLFQFENAAVIDPLYRFNFFPIISTAPTPKLPANVSISTEHDDLEKFIEECKRENLQHDDEPNDYIDSQLSMPRFIENESKYLNKKPFVTLKSSTPLKTPLNGKIKPKVRKSLSISINDSPIARAFQKSFEKHKSFEMEKSLEKQKSFEMEKSFEKQKSFEMEKSLERQKSFEMEKSLEKQKSFEMEKSLEKQKSFEIEKSSDNYFSDVDGATSSKTLQLDKVESFDSIKSFESIDEKSVEKKSESLSIVNNFVDLSKRYENVLKYFLLNDIIDLFDDTVEVEPSQAAIDKENFTQFKQTVETLEISLHKLNESVRQIKPIMVSDSNENISDMFAEESTVFKELKFDKILNDKKINEAAHSAETQHTVTQILKIVNEPVGDSDNLSGKENITVNGAVQPLVRNNKSLDIFNSIDDIFGSDDDPEDVILPTQCQTPVLPYRKLSSRPVKSILGSSSNLNKCIEPSVPATRQPSVDLFETTSNLSAKKPLTLNNTADCKSQSLLNANINLSTFSSPTSTSESNVTKKSKSPPICVSSSVSPSQNSTKTKPMKDQIERSPSLIVSRKINLNRLRSCTSSFGSAISSAQPFASATSSLASKSPLFVTCNSGANKLTGPTNGVVGSMERKIVDLSRFECKINDRVASQTTLGHNESIIGGVGKPRNKRVIFSSSSEDSDNSEDVVYATCPETKTPERRNPFKKPKKRRKCAFIEDECGVSDDDADDHEDEQYLDGVCTSLIAEDDVDDHEDVDMHAKYLQSIRSPIKKPGAFRIPDRRKYLNMENIFSQQVAEETISAYKEDSFVVTDNEEECEDDNSSDFQDRPVEEMSILERAEMILKQSRKQKRKGRFSEADQVKKRRKILIRPDDGSSSDSD